MKKHKSIQLVGLLLIVLVSIGNNQGQISKSKITNNKITKFTDPSKTKILVLGTSHLNTIKDCLDKSSLEPLLTVLARFQPDVVAIEKVPARVLEDMANRGGFFKEIIENFDETRFESGIQLQNKLNISRADAEKQAKSIIEKGYQLSDSQRIELINLLIAAFDYESAVLQWSYLNERPKLENNKIPANIVERLENSLSSPNEIFSIGSKLAGQFKLSNIFGIDDHYDEESLNQHLEKLLVELRDNQQYIKAVESPFYKRQNESLKQGCRDGNKMLQHFEFINSPEFGYKDASIQWGVWLKTNLPSKLDRSRIAQWEMRNLNIASHIRELTVFQPGKRILVIIGAGHKYFLDRYLSQMMDVKMVQLSEVTNRSFGNKK